MLSLIVAVLFLGFYPNQKEFWMIGPSYFVAFISYLFLISHKHTIGFKTLIYAAIALRIILCFSFPNLSDDIYRFIWDGQLLHQGISPYAVLPSELNQDIFSGQSLLFDELNSKDYYSVYPPVAQVIFYISTFVNDNWYLNSIIMKFVLLLCELGSLFLMVKFLKKLNLPKESLFIYALNPLILIELMGNLHFEAVSVFFLLSAFYFLFKQKLEKSAFALALGAGAKMLPMMFFPFVFKFLKRRGRFVLYFSLSMAIIFLPIFFGLQLSHFAQSLDLYFGKFEFNGSLYLAFRWIGKILSGYNLIRYIGPGMALIVLGYMLFLYKRQKSLDEHGLIHVCLFSICTYYFLSTTVHPWYLAIPLALSVFSKYRFVVLWSGLIFLSYINYSYEPYAENLWLVGVEYIIVFGFLIYELRNKKGDLLKSKPPIFS